MRLAWFSATNPRVMTAPGFWERVPGIRSFTQQDDGSIMKLTPGALRLRLHQKFQHGLRVAWYRDVVRPRILKSAPIAETPDRRFEIHVLTSRHDWLNLIWSLKSFYAASGRRYALCIHEDGTLDPFALSSLQQHFPTARIIRRHEADQRLARELAAFPRSSQFRKTNLLALKVFDFISFLQAERMVLFDSDLLFFDEPTDYLSRLERRQLSAQRVQCGLRKRLHGRCRSGAEPARVRTVGPRQQRLRRHSSGIR